MKLELVPIPVADVDRAKAFDADRLGFTADVDGGVRYAGFAGPDGNGWTLQEMPWGTGDAF